VEAAFQHINANKEKYGIKSVTKPHEAHYAYSIYLKEPGGNDLEIEYYNPRAAGHGRHIAATPWRELLTEDRFPGRGYIPQAMSHGTLQCDDKDASRRFYEEVLGLQIAGGGHRSVYIKHHSTPWYIVVLPDGHRQYLSPVNRFTLKLASAEEVIQKYDEFKKSGQENGVTHVEELQEHNGHASFIFSDLDRNWWEFTS